MKKIINITAKDIKNGKRQDCSACPIALAATRAFKIKMGCGAMILSGDEVKTPNYYLPIKAMRFIKDFDGGKTVAPFKFTIKA